MFNIILYIALNLLPLHWNYYVSKIPMETIKKYKINCQIKKQINQTKSIKKYMINKIVNIYKQFIPDIVKKCRTSKKPIKCVKSMTTLEYNRYITWINNFNQNSQNLIYQSVFNIIRNWYVWWVLLDSRVKKEISKMFLDKALVVSLNNNSNLSNKTFNKIIKEKINISNSKFVNILKILLTDESISNFNLDCSKISVWEYRHFQLSNKLKLNKRQDINEIKMIVKNNKNLTCDNITNICYNISDTIEIINNMKQKYLSWYTNNFTGAIKYILKNQNLLLWTGVKISKIKLNKERINLTYNLLNKLATLSGNKLIIHNSTGAIKKIHEIYKLKYGKDLFILIKSIKLNKLNNDVVKKTIKKNIKKHNNNKIISNTKKIKKVKKIKKGILKKEEKLIKENKEKIKKQLEQNNKNSSAIYVLWWTILLILILWWVFIYYKKKYEF